MTNAAVGTTEHQPQQENAYRAHVRGLEKAVQLLERGDLDPEQALQVFREACSHHAAAEAILQRVSEELGRLASPEGCANETG